MFTASVQKADARTDIPSIPFPFAHKTCYKFVTHTQEFIRREVKPKSQIELREGILRFWRTVTASKCRRYIDHLCKVIPRMIEFGGEATGY